MKKAILILCVVALVVTSTAAMASSTFWVVKFKAGAYDGTAMNSFGTLTLGASNPLSQSPAADPTAGNANLASLSGGAFYGSDRQDSTLGAPYTFTMVSAVSPTFSGNAYMTIWSPDKFTSTGRAIPTNYTVRVQCSTVTVAGVLGFDRTYSYADLFRAADPTSTAVAATAFAFTPGATSDSWTPTAPRGVDVWTVTVNGGTPPVTPEPGSMLALGSGLVGLAGFALRRRGA